MGSLVDVGATLTTNQLLALAEQQRFHTLALMSSSATALQVAEAMLLTAEQHGIRDISARKLQKLLYFVQLYHFALFDSEAFQDNLKAWDDGPVVPDIWHKYKRPPESAINAKDIRDKADAETFLANNPKIAEAIRQVIEDFGTLSQKELIDLTHGQKPWLDAWRDKDQGSDLIMKIELRNFARQLLRHTRSSDSTNRYGVWFRHFHQTSGDVQMMLGKLALASAAGELSEALALRSSKSELTSMRERVKEAFTKIEQRLKETQPVGIDWEDTSEIDQFAVRMTDYAMEHRAR